MNILMITDRNESERIREFMDQESKERFQVRYFRAEDCRRAWEMFSETPFLFDVIYIGKTSVDLMEQEEDAGAFDPGYLEKIYKKNPRILFSRCTSRKFFQMKKMSVPYLMIMQDPVSREQIRELMERVYRIERMRYGQCEYRIAVCYRGGTWMVPSGAVCYVKKVRNGLELVTEYGNFTYNKMKMDEFAEKAGKRFLRCRENLLANVAHIVGFRDGRLTMDNGEELLVSRGYRRRVRQYFEQYNILQYESLNTENPEMKIPKTDCINTLNDVK